MKTTKVFSKNLRAFNKKLRYIVNQGGTRSSKTYSVLQFFLLLVQKSKKNLIISIVSESFPHLRMGAIRDFKNICSQEGIIFENYFNKTESTFYYNGHIIEFFSSDNLGKVHGPARDYLFINECNNIKFEVFEQLEIRTKKTIFLDYNPVAKFWVNKEILNKDNAILIKSTYLDNLENLTSAQITSIEDKRHKKNWWKIYGLGEIGFSETLIFAEANLQRYNKNDIDIKKGLVFSYTDTAKGKVTGLEKKTDYFCTVFGCYLNERIYIFDVIFNRNDISENEELLKQKIKQHNSEYNLIETNAEYMIYSNVKKYFKGICKIEGVHTTTNKRLRIMARADYILDNMFFIKHPTLEYIDYIDNLGEFDRLNEKAYAHDDAPDSTAGLAKYGLNRLRLLK